MIKKVMITLTTLLVTILLTSFMGGTYLVNAQEVDENQVTAENLLSMLTDSEAEVTSLFEEIVEGGGDVPEKAIEALNEAQALYEEAQILYDEGSYEECVEKATDALNKYAKALERAQEALEEAQEETEEETEDETEELEAVESQAEEQNAEEKAAKMIGVHSNILKLRDRIITLTDIADALDLQDIDTIEARELLQLATDELDYIDGLFGLEALDESEIVLGRAVRYIGQATGMLKSKAAPMKEQKVEQFIEQTQRRLEQMNNKMTRILAKMGSSEENTLMVQAQYDELYAQLEGIDTKEDLRGVFNQLKQLIKETRQVGKGEDSELFSEEAMESVNDQMDVESRLDAYKEIVDGMAEDDPLKSEVSELILQVESLLDEAETAISEDNEELADQKVEEAEEILEAIEDLFELDEGHGKGVKPENVTENQGKSNDHKKDSESTEEPEEPETTTN